MRANYMEYRSPQFRILSDKQIEELHFRTLQILERTGVAFQCQEALDLLGHAGADVSDTNRVKIPSHVVEQALRTAPKIVTLYDREGKPAIVLDGQNGARFGAVPDCPEYLDPNTGRRRKCYIEDIAGMVRMIDALPNLHFVSTSSAHWTLPGAIADKVSVLQAILNTSKPIIGNISNASNMQEILTLCALVSGGEGVLRKKPFFCILSEPVSPLIQGRDALEKSLLCAEKGIPVIVQSMTMAGASTPATLAGCLAITSAEALSQIVVLQLKNPGTPVIFGGIPSIMDMRTTICSTGAPELGVLIAALTELAHYYGLPMYGTAGWTDAAVIGPQMGIEATYQIMLSALSGQDLVHDIGLAYGARLVSPEMAVLGNEIVGMINPLMSGIEINDETIPLDLIEKVGPGGTFISEKHTLANFRRFWMPTIFDRSMVKTVTAPDCGILLKKRTIQILKTHRPKPLPDDLASELKEMERIWFDRMDLRHEYPKLEQS